MTRAWTHVLLFAGLYSGFICTSVFAIPAVLDHVGVWA